MTNAKFQKIARNGRTWWFMNDEAAENGAIAVEAELEASGCPSDEPIVPVAGHTDYYTSVFAPEWATAVVMVRE